MKFKDMSTRLAILAAAVAGLAGITPGYADTFDGGGTPNNSWDADLNWLDNTKPVSADDVILDNSSFSLPTTLGLDNSFTVRTLSFNTGTSTTLQANTASSTTRTLTLAGNGLGTADLLSVSGNSTILLKTAGTPNTGTFGITLGDSGQFNIGTGSQLDVAGVIAGATRAVEKTGGGTLYLRQSNTFASFKLSSGTVLINATSALGGSSTPLTLAGGTLGTATTGGYTLAQALSITGDTTIGVVGGAAIAFSGAKTTTGDRIITFIEDTHSFTTTNLTLGGNLEIAGTGGTTMGSAIDDGAGSFGITKTSTGTLALNNANTFDGGVFLKTGTVSIGNATGLGTGTFKIGDTTGSTAVTINSTVTSLVNTNNNVININQNFTFTGTQSLDLGTGAVALAAPITLTTTANTLTIGGSITGGNGIFDITKAGNGTLEYRPNITLATTKVISSIAAGTELLSGVLSGPGGLTMASAGTLALSGINTYAGATNVASGTLRISGPNGSVASTTGVTVNPGATLVLDSSTTGVTGATRAASVTLQGGAFTVVGNSTVNSVDTITGALTITPPSAPASTAGNVVTLTPNAATNAQLVAGSLVRNNNAVVLFRGTNLGTSPILTPVANSSNIKFNTAPTAQLIGGDGTDHNTAILPWALADTSATGSGSTFATYDSTNGIRTLAASEYDITISAGTSSDHNISLAIPTITTATVDGDTSVNSLFLTTSGAGAAGILAGTSKLTVTSGAVFANFGSTGLVINKQLDFGTARGIIGATGTNTATALSINSGISGTGGVTFYGSPTTGR